ncbi:MAG: aspartate-semialdehyde dehydrogenase [Myxococcaceae bacterium]
MDPKISIAVVGASGVVGREVLAALAERGVAPEQLTLFASPRSEGEEVDYAEETLPLEKAAPDAFRGVSLALFCAPAEVAKALAPAAQAAGAWVVDTSAAFRGSDTVPLVLPAVNAAVLRAPFRGRIVCCPSAATAGLVTALEPLRQGFGLVEAQFTALLGASDRGLGGVKELEQQTAALLSGRDVEAARFPHRLAFNLIPQVGEFDGEWTFEERSWRTEAARLWSGPGAPEITGTAVQVPTFFGCCLSVVVKLARPATSEALRASLKAAKGVKLLDAPGEKVYPMPMLCTADPSVHVGRVRMLPGNTDRAALFIAIDNAGRGAAMNAVEIGELLARQQA